MNGDLDDRLRRALHAEVDSLEPAGDGLERILRRAHQPWLQRQLSLMRAEWADLFWLIVTRLEPGMARLRQAVATRTGLLAAPAGRRHVARSPRAKSRSGLAWLRPALAVSAAVIVVVAGVYGLAQLRQSLVLDLFPNAAAPAATGQGATNGGRSGPSVQGHTPAGLLPAGGASGSARPSASATCTRAKKKHSPTPNTTPSPSPTGSPAGSPSPTPTATATATASTTAFIASTSDISLAGRCSRSRSPTSAPAS